MYTWLIFVFAISILAIILIAFNNKQLTNCKTCGEQISKEAKSCPHCGAKTPGTILGEAVFGTIGGFLLFPIILLVIIFFVYTNPVFNRRNPENPSNNFNSKDSFSNDTIVSDACITFEEFEKLKNGMTYEHCSEIIGGFGTLSSSSSFGDITYTYYTWEGNSPYSNATLSFENNHLVLKSQVGLK